MLVTFPFILLCLPLGTVSLSKYSFSSVTNHSNNYFTFIQTLHWNKSNAGAFTALISFPAYYTTFINISLFQFSQYVDPMINNSVPRHLPHPAPVKNSLPHFLTFLQYLTIYILYCLVSSLLTFSNILYVISKHLFISLNHFLIAHSFTSQPPFLQP